MQIQVKELTAEWLDLREIKDFAWLSEVLAGSQGRPAPGGGLTIDLQASAYSGNIFVRGRMQADVLLTCSRCAGEWLEPMAFPFDLVLAPAKARRVEEPEMELTEEDVSFSYYEGEVVDLDDAIREQVILQVPEYPLCRVDCQGLCQRCGQDLNRGACACPRVEEVDPRLARLQNLKLVK